MEPIVCTQPMELVHVDYVGMEVTVAAKEKPVVKNVLVVVDHFTRYVQAFVTNNHTAYTTARVLYNNFFSVFGFPQKLISDQGTEFTGDVIATMCKLLRIEKIRTTPYHPQTNGSAERVHQTLQRMIGKLDLEKRQKWPEHIGSVLIAYNATRSQVTGYSPYFLMFGRRPRLPVDLLFPTVNNQEWTRTIDEYVKALYERLRECLKLAQESATKEANRQKRLYDRKVGAVELRPGDRVLVRSDAFQGQRRKLKNRWGDDIHTVIERKVDGIPVYEVKNKRTGKKKVLHRARLLLWLADYGEPVRCNLILISDTLPGMVLGQQLDDSGDGLHPVPGESLLIAYNATRSQVTGYSPYFLMFGQRPRLPVDLLFLTVNNREWTRTIDEYVKALYERLRECLKLAQESATKEANRQKRLYDRKVGAVELRPGDRVLVRSDAFQGQCRKLKNQWGDDIHTVIERKVDGIPVYEVKNKRTGKKKVLHRARLLLWLADYGEPVRCNLILVSDTLPGMVLGQQLDDSGDGLHPVPGESLQYGFDLTHFRAVIDNPEPMTSRIGCEVHTGVPRQAAGQRIPTDSEEKSDPDCLGSYAGDVPVS